MAQHDNVDDNGYKHGIAQGLIVDDAGIGMDSNVLIDVFLRPGETYHATDNAVGGFGVAKIAVFAWQDWTIHTRNLITDKSLLVRRVQGRKGTRVTRSTVVTSYWRAEEGWNRAMAFIKSNNMTNLILNGTKVAPYKGKRFLGAWYHNDRVRFEVSVSPKVAGMTNHIFYRIGGLTQFIEEIGDDIGSNILVDVTGCDYRPQEEGYPFGASRESVPGAIQSKVREYIRPLVRNRVSAKRQAEEDFEGGIREHIRNCEAGFIVVNQPSNSTAAQRKAWRQVTALWGRMCEIHYRDCQWGQVFGGMVAQNRSYNGKTTYLLNPKAFAQHWSHGVTA